MYCFFLIHSPVSFQEKALHKKLMLDSIPRRASGRIALKLLQKEEDERKEEEERLTRELEKSREVEERRRETEERKKNEREDRRRERERVAEARRIGLLVTPLNCSSNSLLTMIGVYPPGTCTSYS